MAAPEVVAEIESLNAFIALLQRNYEELYTDFAAVLVAQGGSARVPAAVQRSFPLAGRIDRLADPVTGAAIFTFVPGRAALTYGV